MLVFLSQLITDSVLSSIIAFELMVIQNRIDQLDFTKQQQTKLDMLRDFILLKSITWIKHDDLFFRNVIFKDEPDLAMLRYKKDDKKIVSLNNFNHDIRMQVLKGAFRSSNFIDNFWHII